MAHNAGAGSHHHGLHGAAHPAHVHPVQAAQRAVHGAGDGPAGAHAHPRVHALAHGAHGAVVLRSRATGAHATHHHGLLHLHGLLGGEVGHGAVWRDPSPRVRWPGRPWVRPHGVVGRGAGEILQGGGRVSLHVHGRAVARHHLHLRRCPLGWRGASHRHGGLGGGLLLLLLLRRRGVGRQVLDGVGGLGLDVDAGVAHGAGGEGGGGQAVAAPWHGVAHAWLVHPRAHGGVREGVGVGLVGAVGRGLDLGGGGHAGLHTGHGGVGGGHGPSAPTLHLGLGHGHAGPHAARPPCHHHSRMLLLLLLLLLLLHMCFPVGGLSGHAGARAGAGSTHDAINVGGAGHGHGAAGAARHADVGSLPHGVHVQAALWGACPEEVVDLADVGVVDELLGGAGRTAGLRNGAGLLLARCMAGSRAVGTGNTETLVVSWLVLGPQTGG